MLALRIILCIIALIGAGVTNVTYNDNIGRKDTAFWGTITILVSIAFCVLIVTTHWNYFAIPKILLFLTVLLWIAFQEEYGYLYTEFQQALFLIGDDEMPHLDTVVSTYYMINHNKKPAVKEKTRTETRYELYVPEGSVISVYEFDAE